MNRRRLVGLVGIFGAIGAVALLIVTLGVGNDSNAEQKASATIQGATGGNGLSPLSVIPNSIATARVPAKASSSATAKPVANAKKPAGKGGVKTGSSVSSTAGGSLSGGSTGTITTGNSKAHCITPSFPGGVLTQSTIDAVSSVTGITYNCISTFANPVASWAEWEAPWMLSTPDDGWDAWLAESPDHQLVVGMDLVPQSVADSSDPLAWEQPCAAGSYNQYATVLATNLVSYGAGDIVIRLGVEPNGNWEDDYVGSTAAEMSDWAKCFDNEVGAMRAVPGANFLFVWNPNACTADLPLSSWYPGNAYVDIIGVDAYDKDCLTLNTVSAEGWTTFSTNDSGNTPNDPNYPSVANIEAFAAAHGKALSFPEWGIYAGTSDDATYVTSMAQMFNQDAFSFESYYDTGGSGTVELGSSIPNATAAYSQEFK